MLVRPEHIVVLYTAWKFTKTAFVPSFRFPAYPMLDMKRRLCAVTLLCVRGLGDEAVRKPAFSGALTAPCVADTPTHNHTRGQD
eukprot:1178777-Pleurochrysis_carterae.AAC.1